LSNHTGYKTFKGQVLNDKDLGKNLGNKWCKYAQQWNISNVITALEDLVDGLAQNDLDNYTHLLTGYIGSASFLKRVALLVTTLKAKNPNLTYGTLSFK